MRILVYGAGVLGCELAHALIQNKKNVVTLLARGEWKEMIDQKGLTIRHWVQRKTTVDRVQTIDTLAPDDCYDLVFVVMQAGQLPQVLPILKENKSSYFVFVGNDPQAKQVLEAMQRPADKVAFGFQNTAGRRQMEAMLFVMAKTPLGRLCASDHAMHAVGEMHYLDDAFEAMRKQAGTAMPMWEKLRSEMPSWDALQKTNG